MAKASPTKSLSKQSRRHDEVSSNLMYMSFVETTTAAKRTAPIDDNKDHQDHQFDEFILVFPDTGLPANKRRKLLKPRPSSMRQDSSICLHTPCPASPQTVVTFPDSDDDTETLQEEGEEEYDQVSRPCECLSPLPHHLSCPADTTIFYSPAPSQCIGQQLSMPPSLQIATPLLHPRSESIMEKMNSKLFLPEW
ncbi:hypothetical protein ACA910_014689 [Epithemia clementina (nom. ined.)]